MSFNYCIRPSLCLYTCHARADPFNMNFNNNRPPACTSTSLWDRKQGINECGLIIDYSINSLLHRLQYQEIFRCKYFFGSLMHDLRNHSSHPEHWVIVPPSSGSLQIQNTGISSVCVLLILLALQLADRCGKVEIFPASMHANKWLHICC